MTKKILLIDDDNDVSKVVLAHLLFNGFETEVASDGESGFEKARTFLPDVILLDIIMPGWSGIETADSLKKNPGTADIPIIFVTGMGGNTLTMQFLEKGNYHVLNKPFMPEQLLAILSNDLGMDWRSKRTSNVEIQS